MARDPIVKISFIGDAGDLSKSIADVDKKLAGVSSDVTKHTSKMSGAFKKMGSDAEHGFKGVRDSADDSERRITGFRDSLTGTQDVMKGLREGDMVALSTGFADLASSVANLGADMLSWGKKAFEAGKQVVEAHLASVVAKTKDIAITAAHKVATVASTVATQAQAAAQWALNVAMEANPIFLVVAAIAALTAGVILAYQHFGPFHDAVDKAWQILQSTFDWLKEHWPLILAILTGPIGIAVLEIVKHWDKIKGGFTDVKDWISTKVGDIVGIFTGMPDRLAKAGAGMFDWIEKAFKASINVIIRGWNEFTSHLGIPEIDTHIPGIGKVGGWSLGGAAHIDELASGGMVRASPGGTVVRLGEGGQDEFVIPRNRMGGGDHYTINVSSLDPRESGSLVVEALMQYQRRNGHVPITARAAIRSASFSD